MTVENVNIEASIQTAKELIAKEKNLSPALKVALDVLLLLVSILANRLGLNCKNSSKPPSADPNREKKLKEPGDRKPGGQHGHVGTTLKQVSDPDQVKDIKLDRSTLPPGSFRIAGYETRQVVDIDISTFVTEWRAEVIEHQNGKRYVAEFPKDVTRPVQYGIGVKSNAVYLSQYQLIPYNRVEEQFQDQMGIPISAGTINNFNRDAFKRLESFESWVKKQLISSALVHSDETGINIGGKRRWLHNVSNEWFTFYYPHEKRGCEANNEMGILPVYKQVLLHWFSYRKANRERPIIGDRRPPSPLGNIQPDHWLAEYTTELINLINVLGLLVELEPKQADLLERICSGPTLSVTMLDEDGAFDLPAKALVGNKNSEHPDLFENVLA